MIIFKTEQDLTEYLGAQARQERVIAFIPTMGALHEGHKSLIDQAKISGGLTICSIFINPTQFNDKLDFQNYPITEKEDISLLLEAGCDVLFMPSVEEIYPQGVTQAFDFDLGDLGNILEGQFRPGHFQGVSQIVDRLLSIVKPHFLYLGQKDYQQCMVISKLLEPGGRHESVQVVICPTVREEDGLAMSSRNRRLTDPQRALAASIYQCLVSIQGKQSNDLFQIVQKQCLDLLREKGFDPEYVSLASASDLSLLEDFDPGKPMIALVAAKIGDVRLIDNLLINPEHQ
jgi:pantoate--beta-alanine ligase